MIDIEVPTQIQLGLYFLNVAIMTLVAGIVLTHIISKFFMVKTPIKLKVNSFVVITGGCMGIGKQMALEIARLYHCSIMIVDIKRDLFQDVNSQITKLGSICQCYYCDLSNDEAVDQFISNINERNIKIDLFIHNAGIIIPKKVLDSSQKQLMLQMKINFLSPVKIIKQTISLMEGGHIAVIASMVTLAQGGVEVSSYSASKYALKSFLDCFRQQLKQSKRNISISIGCPYAIKTTMFTGFKTKLDFLFRWLDETYVAKRLVKQFVQKKQVCYIYQYEAFLFKIVSFLPSGFSDIFSLACNVSDFSSIKDKHKQLSDKKQNKN